ncbi:MAG: 3-phosphoshikimate 1-carboxyvinyltransferase [Ruminococcaceae bacterium]|nr:3-phosphoshikimate 1-carboxyvinyltransferase [Oscillospiraceae bacterium]
MVVEISKSTAQGEIVARSSKSYMHRALIGAALCDGETVIENIAESEDITATIKCLEKLGAKFTFSATTVKVQGISPKEKIKNLSLFANESGSTLRFLIPVSLLYSENVEFTGSKRLLERPQTVYEEIFPGKNCFIKRTTEKIAVGGCLKGGLYECKGDISSQFLTGLLFTLPLLNEDSTIHLITELQSSPYIDLTLEILNEFGVKVERPNSRDFVIKGNQEFKPTKLYCEGDWSNAAFLDAFNLTGGSVTLKGLNENSTQGDKIYRKYFEQLKQGTPTLDITDYPDLAPILMTMASILNGATLKGTSRLKIKESDRGEVMKKELEKFSADITVLDDEIIIKKADLKAPTETLCGNNDHRIAMSLAVISSAFGGKIENAECVNKSYPLFFKDCEKLGINLNLK